MAAIDAGVVGVKAWVIFWLAPSLVDVNVSSWAAVIEAVTLTPAADKAWLRSSSDLTVAVLAVELKATAVAPTVIVTPTPAVVENVKTEPPTLPALMSEAVVVPAPAPAPTKAALALVL